MKAGSLAMEEFDRWLMENYHKVKNSIQANATDFYSRHSKEAERLGIPMVIAEGVGYVMHKQIVRKR